MIVSMAFWRSRRAADQGRPVSSLIDQLIEDDFRFNHHLYMDGDELLVHRVLRFETLADDLADVAVRLGTTMPAELPRAKGGIRPGDSVAEQVLTARQKQRIVDACPFQFGVLGYDPERC